MPIRSYTPTDYYPSSPRAGNEGSLVFRMQNMLLRGEGSEVYAECYGGSLNLGEDIATSNLTGTLALDSTSLTVVGTGTAFTTELHIGQFIVAGVSPNHSLLVVDEIIDATHITVCRKPNVTVSGVTGTRLPVLFEMNKKRGTLLRGNAITFDQGTILCVGDGTLRINGSVLSGTSLVATSSPKIAILNSGTGNYNVFTLGMATPATLSAVDGGLVGPPNKNMQIGLYSVRACAARLATVGFNNPSPKAEVAIATAGHKITATFPAADTTNGQDAWVIFVTLFTQTGSGINGPWYRLELPSVLVTVGAGAGQIPAAGGTYDIEYNDAEVAGNDLLSFNNDPPPKAEFVGIVGGSGSPAIPVWISCMGPGALPPGPFIAPAKANNVEAAPAAIYVCASPPDTIIGYYPGSQGRLYLLGTNSLQIAVATQTTDPRIPPVVVRPFWRSGFKHPYQLLFIGDVLVGITNNGLARSAGQGDESEVQYNFATAINELVLGFSPGHMLIAQDPKNNAVCLFMSGYSLNTSGFWTTRVLMFGLREGKWIGDVLLTSTDGDMLVSGVATISDRLEFLAGGRQSGGGTTVRTYRWDEPSSAATVPYYIAWQFTDGGEEKRSKRVGPYFSVVAKQDTGGTAGIYGAKPGDSIPVTALEAGNHAASESGTITLPSSSTVSQYNEIQLNCANLKQFTYRHDGTWTASALGARDRIDEMVLEWATEGAER
jgi:hypothetical protein